VIFEWITQKSKCFMQKCFFIIIALGMYIQARTQDYVPHSLKEELVTISMKLLNALGTGDTVVWSHYMADNGIITNWDGHVSNKQQQLQKHISPLPKDYKRTISIVNPVVSENGNTAILFFVADERLEIWGQPYHAPYYQLDTYTKINNEWKLLASMLSEMPVDPVAIKVDRLILASYTGTYQLADGMRCTVTLKDGQLVYQKTGGIPVPLLAEAESVFFVKGKPHKRVLFSKGNKGIIVQMTERRAGADLTWKKII
jgi:hypothetical protein